MQAIVFSPPPDTGASEERSWWLQDADRRQPAPVRGSLTGEHRADVVIVGGGYTGLWTALILKEQSPDLKIVLVEAGRCGRGASGRNGGTVHGYWGYVPTLEQQLDADRALEIARLGTVAQDRVRAFATAPDRDVWWREAGYLRVSTSDAQDTKLRGFARTIDTLSLADRITLLSRDEVRALCDAPSFRGGLWFSEGANVHPALLASALRQSVIDAGVEIFENTPVRKVEPGQTSRVTTTNGTVMARDVVLCNYTGLMSVRHFAARNTIFSSFPVMSRPAPEALSASNWTRPHGIADMRMFQHYFRPTPDGRVLMGSGSGRMACGRSDTAAYLHRHAASMMRAETGLQRFLPAVHAAGIETRWGWPIEVSSDRLPFFGTIPDTRVHFGGGYSGHGVNPTCLGGHCLSSLVLRRNDQWTMSPFCRRDQPRLPPEPFRYVGARVIQRAILHCEDAEDAGRTPHVAARMIADMPRRLGLRIGVR